MEFIYYNDYIGYDIVYVYCVIVLVKLIVENEGVNDILVIEFVCLFYDIVDEKVVDVNK